MEPTRLLRLSRSYVQARAMQLAVNKGLFSWLAETPQGRTCDEIAAHLGFKQEADFRGTRDFLDLLVSIATLERAAGPGGEDLYSNSPEAAAFLVEGQPGYVGGYMAMEYSRTFAHMVALEEALTQGRVSQATRARLGILDLAEVFHANPAAGVHFARAMSSVAVGNFRLMAERFDFSCYATLCDVGGSLGTLSLEVCKRHPHLRAKTADVPNIEAAARDNVAAAGLADRVEVVSLDMFAEVDPFPTADVVTLSQILHDWGLPKKKLLLRKAYAALPPGGACIVVERLIDDKRRVNTSGLAQSLVMLLEFGTENSFDFTFREWKGWAEEAGFVRFEKIELLPDWGAAVAYK